MNGKNTTVEYAWYVGATGYNEEDEYTDFSEQYIKEGRWENRWNDKFLEEVKQIKVGDRIALKASYTKKKGLPFDNNGKTVGVMGIKAIGIVTENPGDGKNIKVRWEKTEPIKEWYGKGTLLQTIHLVKADGGTIKKYLLDFTFANKKQDYVFVAGQYIDDIEPIKDGIDIYVSQKEELTIDDLGKKLSEMYNEPGGTGKVAAVYIFCLKYGKQINELKGAPGELVKKAGIAESYQIEVAKGLSIYKAIASGKYGIDFGTKNIEGEGSREKTKKLPEREARTHLEHPLNRILYGAPGTGKTYATVELAMAVIENRPVSDTTMTEAERKALIDTYNSLVDEGRIVFTTFHQNYGYEDFIQGLRPDTEKCGLSFKNVDGVFKQISDRAMEDEKNDYVIIIDEINRANISKVFGELITLIEEDKRWGERNQTSVTLPSGEIFAIPNNLYIIGTMNSSDKSISLIDAALRRRFIFIEQKPKAELIIDKKLRKLFEAINARLVNDLNSTDLLIGHSYFIEKSWEDVCGILNNSIIPLLYEYYYDNRKKVSSVLSDVLKDSGITIVDEQFGRLFVKK